MKKLKNTSLNQKSPMKIMNPYQLQILALAIIIVAAVFIALVGFREINRQYDNAINTQSADLKNAIDEINYTLKSSKDQLQVLVGIMARPSVQENKDFENFEKATLLPETQRFHLIFERDAAKASISGVGNPTEMDLEKQNHILEMMALTPFFKMVHEQIENIQWIYFVSKEESIVLYPSSTAEEYVFDYGTMKQEFYTLTLPESNPSRQVMATKVYQDEVGAGLMVTLTQPVYRDQTYLGALALDITLDQMALILQKHLLEDTAYFLINDYGEQIVVAGNPSLTNKSVTDRDLTIISERSDIAFVSGRLNELPWELQSVRPKGSIYTKIILDLLPLVGLVLLLIAFSVLLIRQIRISSEIYNNQLRFEQVVNQSVQLLAMLDKRGRMIYVNQMALKMIGGRLEDLIGLPFEEGGWWRWSQELMQFVREAIARCNLGETIKKDVVHYNQKGEMINVEFSLNPIYNAKGEIEYLMASGKDITERIKLKESMERLSKIDMLTNISNRRGSTEFLENEIGRAKRQNQPLCILLGDIDFFKRVNDTFGHNVGDQVLVKICAAMGQHLRDYDHLGRWGGEEFIIILQGATSALATETAKRMCRTVMETEFFGLTTRLNFPVTMTFGVSEYRPDMDINDFIKSADDALYYGKKNGRNQVVVIKGANSFLVERL